MKRWFILFLFVLILPCMIHAQEPASALEKARAQYRNKIIEFQNEYMESLKSVSQQYRKVLAELAISDPAGFSQIVKVASQQL